MLGNRGSRFDTGCYIFSFFFNLVEKNLLRNFLSVAKMASLVYERENCVDEVILVLMPLDKNLVCDH